MESVAVLLGCLLPLVCSQFLPPDVVLQAGYPAGFRAYIPDFPGCQQFAFHGKINSPFTQDNELGSIFGEVLRPQNGFWVVEDYRLVLTPGDTVHFWTFVMKDGVGYPRYNQTWKVPDPEGSVDILSPIRPPQPNPQKVKDSTTEKMTTPEKPSKSSDENTPSPRNSPTSTTTKPPQTSTTNSTTLAEETTAGQTSTSSDETTPGSETSPTSTTTKSPQTSTINSTTTIEETTVGQTSTNIDETTPIETSTPSPTTKMNEPSSTSTTASTTISTPTTTTPTTTTSTTTNNPTTLGKQDNSSPKSNETTPSSETEESTTPSLLERRMGTEFPEEPRQFPFPSLYPPPLQPLMPTNGPGFEICANPWIFEARGGETRTQKLERQVAKLQCQLAMFQRGYNQLSDTVESELTDLKKLMYGMVSRMASLESVLRSSPQFG